MSTSISVKEAGRRGGKRCLVTMTDAERSERARKAVMARWAKRKKKKAA